MRERVELVDGVARDRLLQRALVAALRHADGDGPLAERREPRLVQLEVVGHRRHEDLAGHAERRRVVVEPLDDAADEVARRELLDLVDHDPLAPDDAPAPHVEHLHGGFELVVGDAEDVEVLRRRR